MRTSLNEIDVVLAPLKNRLKEAQDPVKEVHDAIHTVEFDVRRLVNGTEALIKRYGEQPPDNVEKCARGLNEGISSVTTRLPEAKDRMVEDLTSLLTPLGKGESALHVVDGYLKSIQTRYSTNCMTTLRRFGRSPTRSIWRCPTGKRRSSACSRG